MCTHVIMTPQPPVVFFAGTEPAPTGASPRGAQARSAPRPAPRPGCGEQRRTWTWTVRAGRRGCTVTTSTNGIALRGRNRPGTRARGPR